MLPQATASCEYCLLRRFLKVVTLIGLAVHTRAACGLICETGFENVRFGLSRLTPCAVPGEPTDRPYYYCSCQLTFTHLQCINFKCPCLSSPGMLYLKHVCLWCHKETANLYLSAQAMGWGPSTVSSTHITCEHATIAAKAIRKTFTAALPQHTQKHMLAELRS